MKIKVYTLNAFGKTNKGGNPAGVVLDADNLNEEQMKSIAKEVGFSETAFIMNSEIADFKLRFFTPSDEVDLCGHATIASFYLLSSLEIISQGSYTQETKAGVLNIDIEEDGTVYMTQTSPIFSDILNKEEIADSLNISSNSISNELPIEIVSTGLPDIIVPVKSLDDLFSIVPDFDEISRISKKYNAVGYHVFTFETETDSTAHSRNFAPLLGIFEESATGTATGALVSYLYKYNKISTGSIDDLNFEQGYSMNMHSEIKARLKIKNKEISVLKIGGKGSNIKELNFEI